LIVVVLSAYHFNDVPVAVKAVAAAFWQYATVAVTVGALGAAFTVTVVAEDVALHVLAFADHWTITNTGTPLPHPLEAWREPFGASSGGLGLGLYIALNIADVLGMELQYVHREGVNVFIVSTQTS